MSFSAPAFRLKFPALRRWTYLNAASGGPVPLEVLRAGCESYESLLQNGDVEWERQLGAHEQARRDLAGLLGCRTHELAFTRNTSHGANLVAEMLWEAGARRAVAFEDEFPASTIPFLNRGFEVKFLARGEDHDLAERVDAAVSQADVLVASHVMYATGRVQDPALLAQIAESHGALFVCTVTQSLGALTFDFQKSGAHFALGTSHKWLCGGYGGGYLAMRDELLGKLRWPQVGWTSVEHPGRMRNDATQFVRAAKALEMGCAPFPVILALGAAARLWMEADPLEVESRIRTLTARLRRELRAAGFTAPELPLDQLSGITTVPVADAPAVAHRMLERNVVVTARGVGIRFSVHAFNDEADLTRGVAALAESVRG